MAVDNISSRYIRSEFNALQMGRYGLETCIPINLLDNVF